MYIDHGYIELHIPPKKKFNSRTREVSYDFAMEANYCKKPFSISKRHTVKRISLNESLINEPLPGDSAHLA